jgi:ribosomal protein S18 acetylase RimI-like enzyme
MIIRAYEDTDKEAVASLWREVFPDAPAWNPPEKDIERKLKVQRELFFVAQIDDKLVGTAMGGFDGHRGWVYYVASHPEYRRQGIGAKLMKVVEDGLVGIGCHKLNLQVRATNTEVVDFYKTLGYHVEERVSMGKLLVDVEK